MSPVGMNPQPVLELAARLFDIPVKELVGPNLQRRIAHARHAVAYALDRRRCFETLADIGRVLGNREHSTITNSIRVAGKRAAVDPEYADVLRQLVEVEAPAIVPLASAAAPPARPAKRPAHSLVWRRVQRPPAA